MSCTGKVCVSWSLQLCVCLLCLPTGLAQQSKLPT